MCSSRAGAATSGLPGWHLLLSAGPCPSVQAPRPHPPKRHHGGLLGSLRRFYRASRSRNATSTRGGASRLRLPPGLVTLEHQLHGLIALADQVGDGFQESRPASPDSEEARPTRPPGPENCSSNLEYAFLESDALQSKLKYEWDEAKNRLNFAKHGLKFKDAGLVFSGPCVTFQG
jgi:hypothetical protein